MLNWVEYEKKFYDLWASSEFRQTYNIQQEGKSLYILATFDLRKKKNKV